MQWTDPAYCDIRLGFEVTAYVYVRCRLPARPPAGGPGPANPHRTARMTDTATPSPPAASERYALNPMYLFRWEPTQDSHVLLYPEGIVKLNQTAGDIIERCDGKRTVAELIAELQQRYPGDDDRVAEGVYKFLEVFRAKGWIRRQA